MVAPARVTVSYFCAPLYVVTLAAVACTKTQTTNAGQIGAL